MEEHGTKFLNQCVPLQINKLDSGELEVTWRDGSTGADDNREIFDTVLMAIGREPETQGLGLENSGVKVADNRYIICNQDGDFERTTVPHIYAIGDILKGGLELTPVAIQAGRLLANRLFAGATKQMDYHLVPTTVFTPLEYSCCGLSEEDAIQEYGEENIEVYHAFYKPLEYNLPDKDPKHCFIKAIMERGGEQRVRGLHFLGPNAGEVMQGFAMAMRCNLTWEQFHTTVGIHPTNAEEVVKLHITKRSGLDPTVTGC